MARAAHRRGGRVLSENERVFFAASYFGPNDGSLNPYGARRYYDVNFLRERAQGRLHDLAIEHIHYESGRTRSRIYRESVEE